MKRILSLFLAALVALTTLPFSTFTSMAEPIQQAFILPAGLKEISEQAFAGNTGITTLVIPNGVTSIGSEAFEGCTGITEVNIASRRIQIAPNAFKNCSSEIVFYAHNDSDAMLWAMARGYKCISLDDNSDHLARFSALVAHSGFDPSLLMSNTYASKCLIVRTPDSMDRLPDISGYDPIDIFRSDDHLYYIQFNTEGDTEDCFNFLNGLSGIAVEPDRIGASDDVSAQSVTIAENWGSNDTMGFDVYAPFVAQHSSGSLTIAVIDSGVSQSAWGGSFSDSAISFVGGNAFTDSARHGSKVASIINDCLGTNRSKVVLLPIKVVNSSSMYRTSVIIEGIKHAASHGANIINLSLGWDASEGTSPEIEHQISVAKGKGILIVAAAGNGSGSVMYPASCNGVIAVSALAYSSASGYSVRSRTGSAIDFTAPGMYLSTSAYPHIDSAGDTIGTASTSFAAPQIAAALALISLDSTRSGSAVSVLTSCCRQFSAEGLASSAYGNGMPQLDQLVYVKASDIELKNLDGNEIPSRLWLGNTGNSFRLGWNIIPENSTSQIVTASSSNNDIITCTQEDNNSATITANSIGKAVITVSNGEVAKDIEISVEQPVTDIILVGSNGTLIQGKSVQLAAAVLPQADTGWVTESMVPSDAEIQDVSWSYREYTESTSPNLDGWIKCGEDWQQTATGSRDYASFPITYNTSAAYYNTMREGPYTAFNDGNTKREVINEHGGWIYWHWMYPVQYASILTRTISDRCGWWDDNGNTSDNPYNYTYFHEIKSNVDCPYLGTEFCCEREQPSYNCRNIIPDDADTSSTSGLGTPRFFRMDYFTSTYTDYQKVYMYYRDVIYSKTDPSNGSNIINKIKYVKYDYSGFGATSSSVTWSSTNESIAEVTQDGLVIAKDIGSTIITCAANDGFGTKAEMPLTVIYRPDAEEIFLSVQGKDITDGSISLAVGETVTLKPSILPEEAAQEWTYSIFPKDVVTVANNGEVQALSTGAGKTATIFVTAKTGQNVYTGLTVSVVIEPILLDVTADNTILDFNQKTTVKGTITPTNATNQTITWSSRNPSVATVNFQTGEVTAVAPGTAEIVGTTFNGIADSVNIIVRQPITITFDVNCSSGTCEETIRTAYKDFAIGSLPTPEREYFTFEAWYTATSGGTIVSPDTAFAGNTTLYAHWEGLPYTVTFIANGEEATCETSAITAKAGTKLGALPAATWGYHSFTGWYTADVGGNEVTPDYVQNHNADLTVYAHWVTDPYTVEFNPNGGSCATPSKSAGVETAIGTLPEPERDGYDFIGWFTTRNGGIQITPDYSQPTTAKTTVYAHWTAKPYTMNFDANGGNCSATQATYYVDTEVGDLPEPTKDYYTFEGWYTKGDTSVYVTSTYQQATANDITVIARWAPKTYTMTFDANGGNCSTGNISGMVDTAIGDLPVPENREYYNWLGWFTTRFGGNAVNADYVQSTDTDITVYAHWEGFPYTMILDATGGDCNVSVIPGTVGNAIGTLPTPARQHYTFKGWFTVEDGGIEITNTYVQDNADEITVYAQWDANPYIIIFKSDNSSTVQTIQRTIGEPIGALPELTKEYNILDGWYLSDGTKLTPDYTQYTDTTVTAIAQWNPMQYTMRLHGNSPNNRAVTIPGNSTIYPYYNTEVGALLPTPSCEYYYFEGWYTAETGGTPITASYKHPSISTIDVYAHWSPHPFTVQLNPNGGAGVNSTMTGYVDTAIGTLPTPTRSGCTFLGWYDAVIGGNEIKASKAWTVPATVTIYAHWQSGWVLESEVPSGANVNATSWSYRDVQESTSSSMTGYTADGYYWKQNGTNTAEYANFPVGEYNTQGYSKYATTDKYYKAMLHAPYTASETATTKREVKNAHAGWIYWHWAYNAQYNSSANRIIAYKPGVYGSSKYVYGYWYSIKANVDCPKAKSSYNTIGQYPQNGRTTYDCTQLINNTNYVPASHKTASGTCGLCTWRFYRLEYFTTTYIDYIKYYKFYNDVNYSSTDPGNGSNITNKVKYVKWTNNK